MSAALKPMKHQRRSLHHDATTPIVFDTSDAGTGKTAVRIMAFAKRHAAGKSRRLLVLCTRSNMSVVWKADAAKFAPHLTALVAPAERREAVFKQPADIYIVNHDGVKWLSAQFKKNKKFFDGFTDIVIDESSAFKHHTSQRSAAARKIIGHFKYRACLTATPNSNTITDVFHQVLLLDGGKRLGKLFSEFQSAVAVPKRDPDNGFLRWVDKDGAEEAVFGLLSDIVIRHKLDDCVDIPQNYQRPLRFALPEKQLRAYAELEATQMLQFRIDSVATRLDPSLKRVNPGVLAINAVAVATKLLQVASGAVYTQTGQYELVDAARYELILDLVEERQHPLVLFLWKHQRDLLVGEAIKRGLRHAVFDGTTTDKERVEIVKCYQAGLYDVLFAHPKSIGHGTTLTAGTSTIWASPTYDLELYVQASSRQRRIGQKYKTETIVLLAEGTIDEKVYTMLESKDARMTNLLDLFSMTTASSKN